MEEVHLYLSEKRRLSSSFADTKIKLERIENKIKVEEALRKHQEKALEKLVQVKLDEITKVKSINEYSNTSIYSEIKTNQTPSNTLKIILLGFISGFFLSIFIVLIRKTLLQEQK